MPQQGLQHLQARHRLNRRADSTSAVHHGQQGSRVHHEYHRIRVGQDEPYVRPAYPQFLRERRDGIAEELLRAARRTYRAQHDGCAGLQQLRGRPLGASQQLLPPLSGTARQQNRPKIGPVLIRSHVIEHAR